MSLRRSASVLAIVLAAAAAVPMFGSVASAQRVESAEVPYEDLPRVDAEIFMDVGATDAQISAVRNALLAAPEAVVRFAFLDHDDAYTEFTRIFGKRRPDLVASTPPTALPMSFRVEVADVDRIGPGPLFAWQTIDGVGDVVLSSALDRKIAKRRTRCDYEGTDVEAYLEVGAGDRQVQQVKTAIRSLNGVDTLEYVSQARALRIFRCFFAGDSSTRNVTAAQLPASFRITIERGTDPESLVRRLEEISGVDEVAGMLVPRP